MSRESGWYRVKTHTKKWKIAEWGEHWHDGTGWMSEGEFYEHDGFYKEVDETPINPEPADDCFNYVDITTKGCEGWINLFVGDECIACITRAELAERVRHVAVNRRLMEETRVIKEGEL